MKYLLDTHVALWAFGKRARLSEAAEHAILDPANKKHVSIASAWELAIKIRSGKLVFEGGIELFFDTIDDNGFELLPITKKHVKQVETLPLLHKDPFDRLLVASAIVGDMCLITADADIHLYDVHSLW